MSAQDTQSDSTATRAMREHFLMLASRTIGVVVMISGVAVLLGWQFDVAWLKSIAPHFVTMMPNTAFAFVLSGALLAFSTWTKAPIETRQLSAREWTSRSFAIALILLGLATLIQYLLSVDFGIDQLLFADTSSPQTSSPGRMAPATAVSFILFGAAFLFVDFETHKRRRPSQWLALVVLANAYLAIMGYLYDVESLYRVAAFTSMAVHTALLFMLLALGLLTSRPAHGFMRAITADDSGGVLIRRLLPVALILPPIVDLLEIRTISPVAHGMGAAIAALINVAVLVTLVWWTARSVWLSEIARREAEAVVKTGEERLHIALQAAGGGVWDWDLVNNVAWWSPEMYKLWNIVPNTTMQRDNSMAVVLEQDREIVSKTIKSAIANRSMYQCEFRVHPSTYGPTPSDAATDGERWMVSRGRVGYDASGNAVRLLGITLDITAQKRAEIALRQANEALERSNIELQRFAHVASHDLQTPMRSVASFVELLQLKYANKLEAQGQDWMRRIVQSVSELQTLVRDLLQYSRVESQVRPFTLTNMREVFDRTVLLLDADIRESRAEVTCGDLPSVMGDATQLAELLLNLIGNALKYRGTKPPSVRVDAAHTGLAWQFAVRDNGIGIAPRHHERVFEIFERLHNQQQYPGTGIGLAICRRVVQRHGGKVWVESEPGSGSTFYFTIPDRTVGNA